MDLLRILDPVQSHHEPTECERGAGLAEYALILLFVALVVLAIVAIYGSQVGNLYSQVTNKVP